MADDEWAEPHAADPAAAEQSPGGLALGCMGSIAVVLAFAAVLSSLTLSCDFEPGAAPDGDSNGREIPAETALMAAVRDGDLDEARRLVQEGADVDVGGELTPTDVEGLFPVEDDELRPPLPGERGNVPPLLVAALNGDREMVSALLLAGADPNLAAYGAYTPVYVAAALGYAPVVMTLVNAGANPVPDTPNNDTTPSEAARLTQHGDIANALDIVTFAQ